MAGPALREVVRRGADRVLARTGARLLSRSEESAIEDRYRAVVAQLSAAHADRFHPPLGDRPGRLELLCRLRGTEVTEALHLLHALQEARRGPGDVCEFGVAQGATSALIAHEIRAEDRQLWLYDSFAGLSAPTAQDELTDDVFGLGEMSRYEGTMAFPVEAVRASLRSVDFPVGRTRIVPGFIRPDLPPALLPGTVAFAYLDFDLYEPILTALRLLHPRCRPGSTLMIDDYGYFSAGPAVAVREFLAEQPGAYALTESTPAAGHFAVLRRR